MFYKYRLLFQRQCTAINKKNWWVLLGLWRLFVVRIARGAETTFVVLFMEELLLLLAGTQSDVREKV